VRAPRAETLREAYFYAVTSRLVDYGKPQALNREGASYHVALPRDPNGAPAERLAGVLVASTGSGTTAVEVDVPLVPGPIRSSREHSSR
jgi:hypothetical protein